MIKVHVALEINETRDVVDRYIREFCKLYQHITPKEGEVLPKLGKWTFVSYEHTSGLHLYRYEVHWASKDNVMATIGKKDYKEEATIFVGPSFNIDTPNCYNIVSKDFVNHFSAVNKDGKRIVTRYVPRG